MRYYVSNWLTSTVFHHVLTNISGWWTGISRHFLLPYSIFYWPNTPVRHPLIFVKTWWTIVTWQRWDHYIVFCFPRVVFSHRHPEPWVNLSASWLLDTGCQLSGWRCKKKRFKENKILCSDRTIASQQVKSVITHVISHGRYSMIWQKWDCSQNETKIAEPTGGWEQGEFATV